MGAYSTRSRAIENSRFSVKTRSRSYAKLVIVGFLHRFCRTRNDLTVRRRHSKTMFWPNLSDNGEVSGTLRSVCRTSLAFCLTRRDRLSDNVRRPTALSDKSAFFPENRRAIVRHLSDRWSNGHRNCPTTKRLIEPLARREAIFCAVLRAFFGVGAGFLREGKWEATLSMSRGGRTLAHGAWQCSYRAAQRVNLSVCRKSGSILIRATA